MKKVYQLLATVGLSIVAISVTAQSAHHTKLKKCAAPEKHYFIENKNNAMATRKVAGTSTQIDMDYITADGSVQSSYSLTALGYFVEELNNRWTPADTNSPSVPRQNFDLGHSATVAFDTLINGVGGAGNVYSAPAGASLTVDTLTIVCSYLNTTTTNDTLFFKIGNVLANGYPGTTTYHTDTVVLNKGVGLPGTSNDSLYVLSVIPNFNLPTGTKFTATVEFSGSKLDTFSLCFGFPYGNCTTAGEAGPYCTNSTFIGPQMGMMFACNSYETGWSLYQKTGTSVMWPNTDGQIYGNGFATDEWNVCGADTTYFYEQDWEIYAGVSYTPTGIENISANGLNVGQNYPNPANQATQIGYSVTKESDVVFSVHDITGREIMNNTYSRVSPGQHVVTINADQLTSGIYFYTFNVNGNEVTKKMVINK